jgi:hypothetical protein
VFLSSFLGRNVHLNTLSRALSLYYFLHGVCLQTYIFRGIFRTVSCGTSFWHSSVCKNAVWHTHTHTHTGCCSEGSLSFGVIVLWSILVVRKWNHLLLRARGSRHSHVAGKRPVASVCSRQQVLAGGMLCSAGSSEGRSLLGETRENNGHLN